MKIFRAVALVFSALVLAGCEKSAGTGGIAVAQTFDAGLPTKAQSKLKTMKLWLGAEELITELALTPDQQRSGMMFRTNMDENAGMIFPLSRTGQAAFWMKNCPLPLSAAYIDPEGVIQEIHPLQPHDTNSVYSTSSNIRFVLETRQGWFDRHKIAVGTVIRTERGSLMETFFASR